MYVTGLGEASLEYLRCMSSDFHVRHTQTALLGCKLQSNYIGWSILMRHTFISYCRDNKVEVHRLVNDLMNAGENVWWDQYIEAGKDWKKEIAQAIRNSYAIILCFSKESELRVESGIYPEVRDAIAIYRNYCPNSLFIFPIRLSECRIPQFHIDSTTMLDDIQWIDLFPLSEWSKGVERLVKTLQKVHGHP